MEGKLRTIIVEDQRLSIDLVTQCLSDRFELVASCTSIKEGWKAFVKHKPDVAVVDIELPDGSGMELTTRMLKEDPRLRVLGVSAKTDEYTLYQVFMHGFFGFVDKNTESIHELRKAIDQLAEGNCYYAATVQQNMMLQRNTPDAFSRLLTEREQELLRYFGCGISNEKIAKILRLRPVSVQNHRARLMKKLGLRTTLELIRYAMQKGFVNQQEFINSGDQTHWDTDPSSDKPE
jgi:two-component system response regulator NreC